MTKATDQTAEVPMTVASDSFTAAAATAANWLLDKIKTGRKVPRYGARISADGIVQVSAVEPVGDAATVLLSYALGSSSFDFARSILGQLANSPGTTANDPDGIAEAINGGLSFIAKSEPNSELEAMLLLQAWMTHRALMMRYRALATVETTPQLEANGTLAVKLGKLFAQQMEVLAKVRTAGKQVIEVQHVHIYPGAQAVIGTVNSGGGVLENQGQPQSRDGILNLTHEPGAPVRSEEPSREAMRQPRGEGETEMPAARLRQRSRRPDGRSERPLQDGDAHQGDGGSPPHHEGPGGGDPLPTQVGLRSATSRRATPGRAKR